MIATEVTGSGYDSHNKPYSHCSGVGLFTVLFLQNYLYNKYSLLIYIYMLININLTYIYMFTSRTVTMYPCIITCNLLRVFSLHVFLNVWPNVTDALLIRCTQWMLTYTGQPLAGDHKGNHWTRVPSSCYVSVSRALEIQWANLHCILHMLSVWHTVYRIMIVSLNHAIIYATALR